MPTPPDRIYLSADSGDFVYVDGKCYRKEGLPGEITHTKEAAYASCEECADSPYFNTPTVTKSIASTPTVTMTPCDDGSGFCNCDSGNSYTVSGGAGIGIPDMDGTYTYHSTLTGGGCSGPNTPAGCGTNSMYANTGSGTTYYLFQCCSSLIGTNYWCCGPTPGDSGAGGAVNTVSADTSSGVAGPGGECPDGVSWSSAGITVTQL